MIIESEQEALLSYTALRFDVSVRVIKTPPGSDGATLTIRLHGGKKQDTFRHDREINSITESCIKS